MSFLAPLFLAGLAALAIPVIIHLTNRPRREVVAFPSLMFVQRIPYRSARRQRIRHWLLFALRCAAVALLALAFARPLLEGVLSPGPGAAGGREVVILVDHSSSMGYADRWARAVQAARRVIDGLGPEDWATLVLFAERATAAAPRTGDAAVLAAALDRARVGARATRYAPALELAREVLAQSELARREVVLITDFQAAGWDRSDAVRLPDGATLTSVDLSDSSPANVAVTGAAVERVVGQGSDRVAISARVVNRGPDPVAAQRVTLWLEGEAVETASTTLPANGAAAVRFAPVRVPERPVRATVEAGGDLLPADDRFHAVIEPRRPIRVLVLEHPNARAEELLYLRRALAIGDDPVIEVTTRSTGQPSAADLAGHAVVIVHDVPITGAAVLRLRQFVERGGGLLVILGRRSGATADAGATALLGGAAGAPVDRLADRGGTLGEFDYDHPVFAAFRAPRSGDFTVARVFRYRAFDPVDSTAVLARLDDGGVAVAEAHAGLGKVLVWTSGFDNFWNDLPVQPVFLPFAHELARYLAAYVPPRAWVTAGGVLDLESLEPGGTGAARRAADGATEWVIESPSGARVVEEQRGTLRLVELDEQGFYDIRAVGDPVGGRRIVAVNLDPAESDLTRLDPDALAGAGASDRGAPSPAAAVEATLTPTQLERRQAFWWYLLVAMLLVLVAETVVANRGRGWRV